MIRTKIRQKLVKTESLPEILRDIAQVFFASVLIGPIMSGDANFTNIMTGSSMSFICWVMSLTIINYE